MTDVARGKLKVKFLATETTFSTLMIGLYSEVYSMWIEWLNSDIFPLIVNFLPLLLTRESVSIAT